MNPRRVAASMLFLVLALASWCAAGAADKPAAKDDKQVVDTKAGKRPSAATIDFRKEYSLPLPSLGTLGGRIEAARRAPDPVALGHAASELAVAEKVSGKKASLTSVALIKEAAELAKLRREVAELRATSQLAQQIADEETVATDLKQNIADA